MANSKLEKSETEMLSKFSEQVSESQSKLSKLFIKVQKELRKLNTTPINEINERGFQKVIDELDKAKFNCESHVEFLKSSKNELMETSLKLYRKHGDEQTRDSPGRNRDSSTGDSGVYSADSRVLNGTDFENLSIQEDSRVHSASNILVAQTSDARAEMAETECSTLGQSEHDETEA